MGSIGGIGVTPTRDTFKGVTFDESSIKPIIK